MHPLHIETVMPTMERLSGMVLPPIPDSISLDAHPLQHYYPSPEAHEA